MPTTVEAQWRRRKQHIVKKGEIESQLLMDSEIVPLANGKAKVESTPSSPTSIASFFAELPLEMKPIILPGAWVVVGKRGKAVKPDMKMYEDPKKKRRQRKRPKKVEQTDAERFMELEETQLAAGCSRNHDKIMLKHDKDVTHGRQLKHWKRYQKEKMVRRLTHEALMATLFDEDEALGDEGMTSKEKDRHTPKCLRSFDTKDEVQRVRRASRQASAAAKCYEHEDDMTLVELRSRPEVLEVEKSQPSSPSKLAADCSRTLRSAHISGSAKRDKFSVKSSKVHGKRAHLGPPSASRAKTEENEKAKKSCSVM